MMCYFLFGTGGIDFSTTVVTATFSINVSMISVNVPVIIDTIFEQDEQFLLTLSAPGSTRVDCNGTATANIIDTIGK